LINDYSGSPYGDLEKVVPCLFTLSEWREGAKGCGKAIVQANIARKTRQKNAGQKNKRKKLLYIFLSGIFLSGLLLLLVVHNAKAP
jgi:hypothetical protein